MKVPSFMLKKLYVDGSLDSDDGGFTFQLKNTLATATLVDAPEIYIDGDLVDASAVTFEVDGDTIPGDQVSDEDPFRLEKGIQVQVRAGAPDVEPGAHKLRIRVATKEWETLDFEVEDTV